MTHSCIMIENEKERELPYSYAKQFNVLDTQSVLNKGFVSDNADVRSCTFVLAYGR
jgi:hypothetical protein